MKFNIGSKVKVKIGKCREVPLDLSYFRLKALLKAKEYAPYRTGALRESIYANSFYSPSTYTITLGATAPYADYQERGVDPFLITTKSNKVIPMMTPEGLIFRTLTPEKPWHHPGIKPKFFLQRAIADIEDDLVNAAIDHVVNEMVIGFREHYVYEQVEVYGNRS